MNFISHMPSPRSLSNSFHCWLNLFGFSFSRSISVISVVFLVVIWRPKKSSSFKSCPFSQRFVILATCYPLELFRLSDILSYPSGVCQELFFHFFSPEAIIPEEFFDFTFQLPLSNYPGASFKCSLFSSNISRSLVSKSHQAYLSSNSSRWFILFQK